MEANERRKNKILLFNMKKYAQIVPAFFWNMDPAALRQVMSCIAGNEAAAEMFAEMDERFFVELLNLQSGCWKVVELDPVTDEVLTEVVLDEEILCTQPATLFKDMRRNKFTALRMTEEEAIQILNGYFDFVKGEKKVEFKATEFDYEFNGHKRTAKRFYMKAEWNDGIKNTGAVEISDSYDRFQKGLRHAARFIEHNTGEIIADFYGIPAWGGEFEKLANDGAAFDIYSRSAKWGEDGLVRVTKFNYSKTHQRKDGTWYVQK